MEERYESDLAQSTRVLDDVDRALERLSEGTYGSCETCGSPIMAADLAADPTRRLCEQHLPLDRLDETFTPTTAPDATSDNPVGDSPAGSSPTG